MEGERGVTGSWHPLENQNRQAACVTAGPPKWVGCGEWFVRQEGQCRLLSEAPTLGLDCMLNSFDDHLMTLNEFVNPNDAVIPSENPVPLHRL